MRETFFFAPAYFHKYRYLTLTLTLAFLTIEFPARSNINIALRINYQLFVVYYEIINGFSDFLALGNSYSGFNFHELALLRFRYFLAALFYFLNFHQTHMLFFHMRAPRHNHHFVFSFEQLVFLEGRD